MVILKDDVLGALNLCLVKGGPWGQSTQRVFKFPSERGRLDDCVYVGVRNDA